MEALLQRLNLGNAVRASVLRVTQLHPSLPSTAVSQQGIPDDERGERVITLIECR